MFRFHLATRNREQFEIGDSEGDFRTNCSTSHAVYEAVCRYNEKGESLLVSVIAQSVKETLTEKQSIINAQ